MKRSFKWSIMVLVALFAFSTIGTEFAYAKGGGGGGGSRSSGGGGRSSGGGWGGGSKSSSPSKPSSSGGGGWFGGGNNSKSSPAAKPTAPETKPASGFGGGKKSNATTPNTGKQTATAPATKATQTANQARQSRAANKQQSARALETFKAQQNKFKAPPSTVTSNPSTTTAVLGKVQSSGNTHGYASQRSYYNQRESYYGNRNWNQPPAYAYNYGSSFGMWDAMFLWMMLDSINDSKHADPAMYYNHQNDPGMKEWREKAEKEAETNTDMKAKLAALDQQVKDLEAKGVARDESYIPPDAGVAALAATVVEKNLPKETPEEVKADKAQSNHDWFFWIFIGVITLGMSAIFLHVTFKKKKY